MKKTTLSALVIALAAGSALAATPVSTTTSTMPPVQHPAGPQGGPGGEHHGPGEHMFGEIDTNHDGFISKDEWTAKGDKMFSDLDANHDGKVSEDEMKAHHDMMRAKWEQHKAEGGAPGAPGGMKTPATNSAPKN